VFTGLVQTLGTVRSMENLHLVIDLPLDTWKGDPLAIGESIAVNGCCLTVVSFDDGLHFDLSEETLRRTSLGSLESGSKVNLERAMRIGDRLGGHIVQGHVDGLGKLLWVSQEAGSWLMRFAVPTGGERYLIDKGSVTVDGISLTVVKPEGNEFDVAIIPHTWENTNLSRLQKGDLVNMEFDVLAKHVEKLMSMEYLDRFFSP